VFYVYVIIAFWVALGLGVFFVAMRGGGRARAASGEPAPESKATRRAITVGIVLAFVFGLVVPGLVLASNAEHKGSVAIGGVQLTAEQQKGRELFAHTCGGCHTLAATNSVGHIGPDLDIRVGDEVSTPEGRKALVLSAILEGRARGRGQMPAGLYQGKEAEEIASFVAAVAGH
jgi:mono/diheme cytochrome c family protein